MKSPSGLRFASIAIALGSIASCGLPEQTPLPPHCFAFGVFGDGPYRAWETGRFRKVIEDVNGTDLEWFLHVGDIFWYPCSDEAYLDELEEMNRIQHPVFYTPGDNEWADCWEAIAGRYTPLDRLDKLREVFFAHPTRSLGLRTISVQTQGADSLFGEFAENVRWHFGGFVFATLHMVGSENAGLPFPGRTEADDVEATRRGEAALAWMDGTFAAARAEGARGVVLAMHGDAGLGKESGIEPGFEAFVARLADHVRAFDGPVLLIHGDDHVYTLDQPLQDPATGETLENFTRLETFGSPDIGWVKVVVDSVAGRFVAFEPRLMSRWWLW